MSQYLIVVFQAARDGILIKGGKHLEVLGKIKIMALDKTGTITEGKFTIADYFVFGDYSVNQFFSILYTLEIVSTHPMAVAICNYAKEQRARILGEVTDFDTVKGEGVQGKLGDTYM